MDTQVYHLEQCDAKKFNRKELEKYSIRYNFKLFDPNKPVDGNIVVRGSSDKTPLFIKISGKDSAEVTRVKEKLSELTKVELA